MSLSDLIASYGDWFWWILAGILFVAERQVKQDDVARPVGPMLDWNAQALARFDAEWLHVKFVEGSSVRLERTNDSALGRFVDRRA